MRLLILAVGRKGPFATETADYLARAEAAGRALGLTGADLVTVEAPRALSGLARQEKEAALLEAALPDRARVVRLDERGRDMPSQGLARLIVKEREAAPPGLAFLIGGADGFAPGLAERLAPRTAGVIAFGKATWPHMLVRLMLAEQLYRAVSIAAGHPYHRA